MNEKYYITTPIYYVNDVPHIGHAYTTIACDIIARFKRLDGFDVMFLTGTDEHGQKIEKAAAKAGVDTQSFTDKYSLAFRNLTEVLNISNDDFIRTSEARHQVVVQEVWTKLLDKGYIYLGKYAGWYAVRDEAFYSESELVEGKAPTGAEVAWVEEPSYFFKLSEFTDKLLEFYEQNPDFILPYYRRNEVINFVKGGLHDLSISRTSFAWGIKVPGDEAHVMYVWLDALFNYYSAISTQERKHFWPADLHVVGKDIMRFHAIYWPAFLMAAELPLPKRVFAHGWWTIEGEKMSKSIGNTIDPNQLVAEHGLDYARYFLLREMPFGNDGDFNRTSFVNRVNAELCNNIGNLAQRTLSFVNKYCDGVLPTPELNGVDQELLTKATHLIEALRAHIDKQTLHDYIGDIVALGTAANEYIDSQAPWTLRKTDEKRMGTVLYTLAEVIRCIAIYLTPVIPDSAAQLLANLGMERIDFTSLDKALTPGSKLPEPKIVFPRIELLKADK
ncbi:MAG: methionine--tRNA ligase [Rickettsiales bacterium]